ncbi:MAG: DUF2911 domain-containing protein [Chitinophagaceae bacterium]
MKKIFSLAGVMALAFSSLTVFAQDSTKMNNSMSNQTKTEDKSKRPSPPANAMETVNGKMIMIDYSSPSVKGRTIGKDVEPMVGKVWRGGANEATVFQTDKDVTIEGKPLPAGKYALYFLNNGSDWTIIFNKKWDQWGTMYDKYKDQDALKVTVPAAKTSSFAEHLNYTISKDGLVSLNWGDTQINFHVN